MDTFTFRSFQPASQQAQFIRAKELVLTVMLCDLLYYGDLT